MLNIKNLTVGYGARDVLFSIDLSVPDRGLVALLGANAAGKTTLLRTVSGVIRARHGSISFGGKEVSGYRTHQIARMGIMHIPEGRGIFRELTVDEHLRLFSGSAQGTKGFDEVFYYFPNLKDRRGQRAAMLSGGEQQMLSLSRAVLQKPKLLMVDELSLGLAPALVHHLSEIIVRLNEAGTAVLLVEENLGLVLQTVKWVFVLQNGRLVYDAPAEEAARNEQKLVSAYLCTD